MSVSGPNAMPDKNLVCQRTKTKCLEEKVSVSADFIRLADETSVSGNGTHAVCRSTLLRRASQIELRLKHELS